MSGVDVATRKADTRREALDRRREAQSKEANARATKHLVTWLMATDGALSISGYMPIGTEIDTIPTLTQLAEAGRTVCLPVIQGRGEPLIFRQWTPDSPMIEGDFGALIPRSGDYLEPDILITPLLAFDATGARMGYGGGFYDRTLVGLRSKRPTFSIGFAFGAQEVAAVPTEATDQRLDALVTLSLIHI